MSVLLTLEDVTTSVQTMLDHSSVIVKLDTLLLAMDFHALVSTDCTNLQLRLLQVSFFLPTQMLTNVPRAVEDVTRSVPTQLAPSSAAVTVVIV